MKSDNQIRFPFYAYLYNVLHFDFTSQKKNFYCVFINFFKLWSLVLERASARTFPHRQRETPQKDGSRFGVRTGCVAEAPLATHHIEIT